ncbi:MAG: hypothetical protein LUI06_06795 [Ruminococcus sp.]|nr:hypothetical protein [Ruminococcus sp.]
MKLKDKRRSRASCIILIIIFVAVLFFFSLGTFFSEDRSFSEMENRTLTQKPEITTKEVFSGDLDDDVETYMSDQIFLKDALMSLKTCCDYFSGKTYQNGVYFSSDGYLLQRYTEDTDNIDTNISYINSFAQKLEIPIDFILAPNSICLNADKLPLAASTDNQLDTISHIDSTLADNITLFNAYETLDDLQNNQGIQAYYRTDHHWTASAARAVCDAWLSSSGYSGTDSDYVYNSVPDFYGTLYSKAPASFVEPDTFGYYENTSASYEVKYISENSYSYSLMDKSYLETKDKYSAFLGGNFAQIRINSNSDNDEKLLVLKDSYANSMIPFLADSFSQVYVIDLRYMHFESVSELVEEYDIDRVLMIYNVDFINEDQNFVWLE